MGIFLLMMLFAAAALINFYYSSTAGQYITSRMSTVSKLLQQYYNDNPNSFANEVKNIVQDWSDKNSSEIMTVNDEGIVTMTSSGFMPDRDILAQDYYDAVASGKPCDARHHR